MRVHKVSFLGSLFLVGSAIIIFAPETTRAFTRAPPVALVGTSIQQYHHHHYKPSASRTATYRRRSESHRLHMEFGAAKKGRYTLALWPIIQKFKIGPDKAKQIVANVVHVTDKEDILVLCFLAFLISPAAKFARKVLLTTSAPDDESDKGDEEDQRKRTLAKKLVKKELVHLERFGVLQFINQFARVALAVYAVDVLSVVLTTIGFTFPTKWQLADGFAKAAYTVWGVGRLIGFKRIALCRFFQVDEESIGRVEILDRILNFLIILISTLLLTDWLSIKMNRAMTGLFAFGSAGTLAITLASQGLVTQLLSGLFLIFSDKMYVGDSVEFGDGTSGKVLRVGWMETLLRGGDNHITRVPNSVLSSQKVKNVSRIRQSQVIQTLRFHYDDADRIPELLAAIKQEIKQSCPRLITDGSRPFRVVWTDFNEDHLQVVVNTHHNIAPLGDAYWSNRQAVLMAIARAVKQQNMELAQLYTFATSAGEPEWRVVPRTARFWDGRQDRDAQLFSDDTTTSSDQEKGGD